MASKLATHYSTAMFDNKQIGYLFCIGAEVARCGILRASRFLGTSSIENKEKENTNK